MKILRYLIIIILIFILLLLTLAKVNIFQFQQFYPSPQKKTSQATPAEACLSCHLPMSGFSAAHRPETIGCASCHLGKPESTDKAEAHSGMVLVPGNLSQAEATCGAMGCHPTLTKQIHTTLMSTGRGLVTVNRYVFGETDSPNGEGHLSHLADSPADDHLRRLCAGCHLGKEKWHPAPIDETSRGGGCTACHLIYSPEAISDLRRYTETGTLPGSHPSLTLRVTNAHCFGCHSRSGRISTNYEGWHETLLNPEEVQGDSRYRVLQDSRMFEQETADVHFQKGMECMDCHTWREVMGDGVAHNHQEEQVEISCEDCHRVTAPQSVPASALDLTELKIAGLRGWSLKGQKFVLTRKTGRPLINVVVNNSDGVEMIGKNSGIRFRPKPTLPICRNGISGHERLSCQSCHTAWAPHCINCHTEFDPSQVGINHLTGQRQSGRWVEYGSDFLAEPPSLGIRLAGKQEIVDTFIPGMILTIDMQLYPTHPRNAPRHIFRRLYAPIAAHTTVAVARDCQSCHANPLAIGYGQGELTFQSLGNSRGQWIFDSHYATREEDGLPYDAWIGFLQERGGMVSTRVGARPFSVQEQKAILQVGACLTCHPGNSVNIQRIYGNFPQALKQTSPSCVLPAWE